MPIADALIMELEQEAQTTRRLPALGPRRTLCPPAPSRQRAAAAACRNRMRLVSGHGLSHAKPYGECWALAPGTSALTPLTLSRGVRNNVP